MNSGAKMISNTPVTADDLVIEILKRTPAKTLTRLRCVSKHWNHLIRRPDFAAEHYIYYSKTRPAAAAARTPVLFSISRNLKRIFYTINDDGEAHHHRTVDAEQFGFKYQQASEVINGIFCLFDYSRKALVCNITTGETVGLPVSCLAMPYWYTPQYSFGFDPVNNHYKVLCVWTDLDSWTAEVFTVGISREWRKIEQCNNINYVYSQSVCVNGIIYWKPNFDGNLVSFNVKDEKFQMMELPHNIGGGLIGHLARVVRFNGHLAIVNRDNYKLLMFGDDDEIWIHDFKEDFKFPSEHSELISTRNSERFFVLEGTGHRDLERFFVLERAGHGDWRLVHYENDGTLLKSTRIIGLEDATDHRCLWQAAINESVENIYPLASWQESEQR